MHHYKNRLIQENSQFTVGGPLILYDDPQVLIFNINYNHIHHLGSPRYVQELQTILGPQNPLRKAVSVKARDPVGSEIYRNTSRNCKIMYCNFSVLYCTNKALRTYGRDT